MSPSKTVLVRQPKADNAQQALDPMNTGSITLSKNNRSLLPVDENSSNKLGVDDPDPDENRINRGEKTAGLNRHESSILPDRKIKELPRLTSLLAPLTTHSEHVASPQKALEAKEPVQSPQVKMAMVIPQKKPVAKLPVPKILKSPVTNDQPDVLALGYAPANAKVDTSPFDSGGR